MSKLTKDEVLGRTTAADYLATIRLPEITIGTDKQIAFANDLRDRFASSLSAESAKNLVWYARRGNGHLDVLADDYINYNTINKINSADAKAIIDRFCSEKSQAAIIDRKLDVVDALKAN